MKTKILLFCFSVSVIIFLDGCKKYEDGPSITLRTAKSRITNQWSYKETLYDGRTPNTGFERLGNAYIGDNIDIKKDGSYVAGSTSSYSGNWSFSSDQKSVTFTPNGSSSSDTYIILKLTNKEFWVQYDNDGHNWEFHYE